MIHRDELYFGQNGEGFHEIRMVGECLPLDKKL